MLNFSKEFVFDCFYRYPLVLRKVIDFVNLMPISKNVFVIVLKFLQRKISKRRPIRISPNAGLVYSASSTLFIKSFLHALKHCKVSANSGKSGDPNIPEKVRDS